MSKIRGQLVLGHRTMGHSMTTLVELSLAHSTGYRFLSMKSLCIIDFLVRLVLSCAKWIKNGQSLIFNPKVPCQILSENIFYYEYWISGTIINIAMIRLIHIWKNFIFWKRALFLFYYVQLKTSPMKNLFVDINF